jgi:hypothetical protein
MIQSAGVDLLKPNANRFLLVLTTTMRSERFSTKLKQIEKIHARNFLKEAAEHALLVTFNPFVKHLPNTCLVKNP